MRWRRTYGPEEDRELPENGQECFIFFAYTGYSQSKFERVHDPELAEAVGEPDYICDIFSDAGGFLGDEDVLWVPIEEFMSSVNPYPYPTEEYIKDYPECKERLKKF